MARTKTMKMEELQDALGRQNLQMAAEHAQMTDELTESQLELDQVRHLVGVLIADLQLNEALVRAYQFRVRRMHDPVPDLEVEQVMIRGRMHNPPTSR